MNANTNYIEYGIPKYGIPYSEYKPSVELLWVPNVLWLGVKPIVQGHGDFWINVGG